MAIREEEDQSPGVLSVLFDRPVFVEDAVFYPLGGTAQVSGKIYSTGFRRRRRATDADEKTHGETLRARN